MKSINLLPQASHSQAYTNLIVGSVQGLLILVTIGLVGLSFWLTASNNRLANQSKAKQTERTQLKQEIERARELQLELAYILDRQTSLDSLEVNALSYHEIITAIAAAVPARLRLTNLATANGIDLTISGVGAEQSEITTFVTNLIQVKQLSGITLTQTNTQPDGILFVVSATIVGKEPQPSPSPVSQQPSQVETAS